MIVSMNQSQPEWRKLAEPTTVNSNHNKIGPHIAPTRREVRCSAVGQSRLGFRQLVIAPDNNNQTFDGGEMSSHYTYTLT